MKKTKMKSLVVACVATFTFLVLQNSPVEAITENRVIKEENLWKPLKTIDVQKQNNEPKMEIPNKTKESETPSTVTKEEKPKKELETPAVSISNEEKDLMARLVEAEAKGEPYEGKLAVATVVLNRVDSPQFPDTVTGVIKQVVGHCYAFTPVQNGEINNQASDESKRAVEEALTRKDRLNNSLYFYNPEIATDDWIESRTVVKTIGNHVFAK